MSSIGQSLSSTFQILSRSAKRELANQHLLVIATAVIVAVAGVTAVDTFTDRVRRALAQQSSTLLAADLAIIGNRSFDSDVSKLARSLNLSNGKIMSMRSVVAAGDALQLVELKGVDDSYPLRGELLLETDNGNVAPATGVPGDNTVWVERRLLTMLDLSVGQTIAIADQPFRIDAVIAIEPDRAGSFFNLAPRGDD